MTTPGRWVLLSYQMPREPSTPRVAVWRKLRRLGVGQIMDGLVALPLSDRNRERLEWVAVEIREASGDAAIWLAQPGTSEQERLLVSRLQQAITNEYLEVAESARKAQGLQAGARRRALSRYRRELNLIRQRDYFPPQARQQANEALQQLSAIAETVP